MINKCCIRIQNTERESRLGEERQDDQFNLRHAWLKIHLALLG